MGSLSSHNLIEGGKREGGRSRAKESFSVRQQHSSDVGFSRVCLQEKSEKWAQRSYGEGGKRRSQAVQRSSSLPLKLGEAGISTETSCHCLVATRKDRHNCGKSPFPACHCRLRVFRATKSLATRRQKAKHVYWVIRNSPIEARLVLPPSGDWKRVAFQRIQ